jgi:hypothetical protein
MYYWTKHMLLNTKCVTKHNTCYWTQNMLLNTKYVTEQKIWYWTQNMLRNTKCVTEHKICYWTQNVLLNTKCVTEHKICYWTQHVLLNTKYVTEHKICVLIPSKTFVWNNFQSKKNWARYDKKLYTGLHVKCRYCCGQIVMKLAHSRPFFKKYSSIKFHKNPSSGSCFVRTDGHEEDNSRFSQLYERA